MGLGTRDPGTNVRGDEPTVTGKIALAHLTEFPDYHIPLAALEREAADHPMARSSAGDVATLIRFRDRGAPWSRCPGT
jgi:Protein of unknown function (DUF5661)